MEYAFVYPSITVSAFAVNLNSGIDFFGKTVNIAKKFKKISRCIANCFWNLKENPDVEQFLESNTIILKK